MVVVPRRVLSARPRRHTHLWRNPRVLCAAEINRAYAERHGYRLEVCFGRVRRARAAGARRRARAGGRSSVRQPVSGALTTSVLPSGQVVRGDGHAGDRDARWSKVMILRNLLEADAQDAGESFVLWMDSDAVFTNFNFSALSVAQRMVRPGRAPSRHLLLSLPRPLGNAHARAHTHIQHA
jgi:hypothetical protein